MASDFVNTEGRRLAVVLSTDMGCFRSILRGVNAYAVSVLGWTLEVYGPHEPFVDHIRRAAPNGVILGPGGSPDMAAELVKTVGAVVGVAREAQEIDGKLMWAIESDDESVGRAAAQHLLDRNFESLAFVGTNAWWSHRRHAGFEAALRERGIKPALFTQGDDVKPFGRAWPLPHYGAELLDWLRSLPKPLGLFAGNDLRGREIASLCRPEGIRVPEDVAILGVDNDDLECELAQPPLSSVAVAWRRMGYEAAKLVERLIDNPGRVSRKPVRIPPEAVAIRQSTDTTATDDRDVSAAVRFIRQNAHRPIGVPDVLDVVPAARRSLEKRFRAALGRSPLEEIRRAHIERAKVLLTQTDLPMPRVAAGRGFTSAAWFSKAFHDLVGETPTEFRQRSRPR